MKKYMFLSGVLALILAGAAGSEAQAADQDTICKGVYADGIDLSGMTAAQAENVIEDYVKGYEEAGITLRGSENTEVTITAAELGVYWGNPEILEEAVSFGKKGNIIRRYKEMMDLEKNNQNYDVQFEFDEAVISEHVAELSEQLDTPAVNATMKRENGEFVITDGIDGVVVDQKASADEIYSVLTQDWKGENLTIDLVTEITKPEGKAEDLAVITDLLSTFTTDFSKSDESRSANVRNACSKVNGTVLYPGEEFSTLAVIAPFTVDNGYYSAGSYYAGKVVDSVGGGICQVSSTLYNAVLNAELEVTYRTNHAMAVGYVPVGLDATVSEDAGIDFTFVNNTGYPVYIEGYTSKDKRITLSIYGVETRKEGHSVEYVNDITSRTEPGPEVVYADAGQPVGYIDVQPAHTGFVADVYKVTYENGVEVSREKITHSTYRMTSRSATVGTATVDPTTLSVINAAVATQSVDYCKAVVAQLATGTYTGPIPGQEPAVDATTQPADGTATQPTDGAVPPAGGTPDTTEQPADGTAVPAPTEAPAAQ